MLAPEVFQPTHLREVRHLNTIVITYTQVFQPTHLREVRLSKGRQEYIIGGFNPRTYVRCDGGEKVFLDNEEVSTHAPT